jgi:hypothetical protein
MLICITLLLDISATYWEMQNVCLSKAQLNLGIWTKTTRVSSSGYMRTNRILKQLRSHTPSKVNSVQNSVAYEFVIQ